MSYQTVELTDLVSMVTNAFLGLDSATVQMLIESNTEHSVSYSGDDCWQLDGALTGFGELLSSVATSLQASSATDLARLYRDVLGGQANYVGDGFFEVSH